MISRNGNGLTAIILAAGQGVRMRPLTKGKLPKQLLKVGNRTLLAHLMVQLAGSGVSNFVASVPDHSSPIVDEIVEVSRAINSTAAVIKTCGTKAGDLVACVQSALTIESRNKMCILMGDLFIVPPNLEKFIEASIPKGYDLVLAYTPDHLRSSGVRLIGSDDAVRGLTRKETMSESFSAGVHLATVRACQTIIASWDGKEPKMSVLSTRAFANLNVAARRLEGAMDVNTPAIYSNLLLRLGQIGENCE